MNIFKNRCLPLFHPWSKWSEATQESGSLYQFRYCERCNAFERRLASSSWRAYLYAEAVNKLIEKLKVKP